MVFVRLDGSWDGPLKPSSEWAMHLAVYTRVPVANAVVHAHADNCVALACFRKPIPAFHYMVQGFGGRDIPCVDYFPFGSQELGEAAGAALVERTACLLANHGMLSRGATLAGAFDAAVKLETLARQYVTALSLGEPHVLTEAEMDIVATKYRSYGRPQPFGRTPRWMVP
jgi:L-fuculose-phosphate aldolase